MYTATLEPLLRECNEAVELAKAFGTAESRAFINGIVDRMGRQLERLPASKKEGPITG